MFTLNCRGRLLLATEPLVMGIINSTPDSFYEGSRQQSVDQVLHEAEKMLMEGADILDIGGQSTRPGSLLLTAEEELQRVVPCISAIHRRFPGSFISVDSFYAKVANECIEAGACIINDVSAGEMDPLMISTVSRLGTPYICMHMKGTPQNMQQHAQYEDTVRELLDYFIHKIEACRRAGIKDIIIDPGFGFAKTIEHNFQLLRDLSMFLMLEKPVMIGLSRKSTVYKTLQTSASEALNGTTVLNTIALQNGASILRVHDVKEAREAVKLFVAYVVA